MSTSATIRIENPRDDGVKGLIAALDAYLNSLYPPDSNHLLDLEQLTRPEVRFFVARRAGAPVGCGALRIDASGYGEVKRMYVTPAARGLGIGRAILARLEAQAAQEGISLLRLETGIHQSEALGLYQSCGYVDCAPFGEYRLDPLSRFMEKRLPDRG